MEKTNDTTLLEDFMKSERTVVDNVTYMFEPEESTAKYRVVSKLRIILQQILHTPIKGGAGV